MRFPNGKSNETEGNNDNGNKGKNHDKADSSTDRQDRTQNYMLL